MKAFSAQGTPIDILQLGNEINRYFLELFLFSQHLTYSPPSGLLWPIGKGGTTTGWNAASQLLHSARQGARDAGFAGKVVIHLADGWSASSQSYFYNNIFVQGAFRCISFIRISIHLYLTSCYIVPTILIFKAFLFVSHRMAQTPQAMLRLIRWFLHRSLLWHLRNNRKSEIHPYYAREHLF